MIAWWCCWCVMNILIQNKIIFIFLFHMLTLVSSDFINWMWCWGDIVSAFGYFLSITSVNVFAFYVFLCVVLFCFQFFFKLIYLWCCCAHWFLWVQYDLYGWKMLWLIILRLSLMLMISMFFYHWCCCFLKVYMYISFHYFILN